MSETKNYKLHLTDDSSERFLDWRNEMNGVEDSNMVKIDTALGEKADLEDGKVKNDQLPGNLILSEDDDLPGVSVLLNADTLGGHTADYFATKDEVYQKAEQEEVARKQDKLSGKVGQIVGFDETGAAVAIDPSELIALILGADAT